MENKPPIENVTEEDIQESSSFEDIKLHKSAKKQHSPLASFADKIKDYTINSIILTYQLINDMPRLFMCLSSKDKYILFKKALTYSVFHDIYFMIVMYSPIRKYKDTLPLLPITIYSSILATLVLLSFAMYFRVHKEDNLSYKYNYDGEYNEDLYDEDGYLIVSNEHETGNDTMQQDMSNTEDAPKIKSKTNILDIDNIVKDNVSHETLNTTQLNNEKYILAKIPKVTISDDLETVLSNPSKSFKHMNN